MAKNLPARPNLDHLRRQAKSLLAGLELRSRQEAVSTFLRTSAGRQRHEREQVRNGATFAWPMRSRQSREKPDSPVGRIWRATSNSFVRSKEPGHFARLEIDGSHCRRHTATSRILIDGDRFRTESPEANYEGIFNINVEAQPHEIDIEFVAGPEAGNWNFGIFRLDGDQLDLPRHERQAAAAAFNTSPGSGQA